MTVLAHTLLRIDCIDSMVLITCRCLRMAYTRCNIFIKSLISRLKKLFAQVRATEVDGTVGEGAMMFDCAPTQNVIAHCGTETSTHPSTY